MPKIFLISGVVVFASMWFFMRYIFSRPEFLSKPEEEQQKTKKQMYFGLYGAIALSFIYFLAMTSKTTRWISWALLAIYILLWVIGCYWLWNAYKVGIRKDISKMNKMDGKPFNNPQK